MTKRLNRILSAAALLPVLLFALAGTSFASWRCQSDGVVRASCCCPKSAAESTASPVPALVSASCCDVQRFEWEKAPSDLGRGQSEVLVSAVVAQPVGLQPRIDFPTAARPAFLVPPEWPPGGRSLVVAKHAFLI